MGQQYWANNEDNNNNNTAYAGQTSNNNNNNTVIRNNDWDTLTNFRNTYLIVKNNAFLRPLGEGELDGWYDVSERATEERKSNYIAICYAENNYLAALEDERRSIGNNQYGGYPTKEDQENAAAIYAAQRKRLWGKFGAEFFAAAYGGLLGFGMAGFILLMFGDVEFPEEISEGDISGTHSIIWGVALLGFISVAMINRWLVRPTLYDSFVFDSREVPQALKAIYPKNNNEVDGLKIATWTICGVGASVIALMTALGIQATIDTFMGDGDSDWLPWMAVPTFAVIIAVSEFCLTVGSLERMLRAAFKGDAKQSFLPNFTEYENATGAKVTYGVFAVAAFFGMLGTALVCAKTLSGGIELTSLGEEDSYSLALSILSIAALLQLPFYLDRAKGAIDALFEKSYSAKAAVASSPSRPVHQTVLWGLNGLFNAPCAYLGAVKALAKLAGLEKQEPGEDEPFSLTHALFEYGHSMEANIVYGIGGLIFLCALGSSMLANSKKPENAPRFDYQGEVSAKSISANL